MYLTLSQIVVEKKEEEEKIKKNNNSEKTKINDIALSFRIKCMLPKDLPLRLSQLKIAITQEKVSYWQI